MMKLRINRPYGHIAPADKVTRIYMALPKALIRNAVLLVFLLTTRLSYSQILNGGFEQWDSTYANVYSNELSTVFGVPSPLGGAIQHWTTGSPYGISQTTDSYSGDYSLILHNWYSYVTETINYKDTISYRPEYLQGYFKYNTTSYDGIAVGTMNVTLTRFNGVSNDTVGSGAYSFDSTLVYTPFQIAINYVSADTPDSIHIYAINADRNCTYNIICNLLYLDNLSLSDVPLDASTQSVHDPLIEVYPNPSNGVVYIRHSTSQQLQFTLYNALGEKIYEEALTDGVHTINLSAFSHDLYFYTVSSGRQVMDSGKLIRQ